MLEFKEEAVRQIVNHSGSLIRPILWRRSTHAGQRRCVVAVPISEAVQAIAGRVAEPL